MTVRITAVAIMTILLSFAVSADAENVNFNPGLWKLTSRSEGQAGPAKVRTSTQCIKPDQASDFTSVIPLPTKSGKEVCGRTAFYQTSTTVNWTLECKGQPPVTGEYAIKFDGLDHYVGTQKLKTTLKGRKIVTTDRIEGQRTGDCPK